MAAFPDLSGSPGSNLLHYMAELCLALQASWIPGPSFGTGRDVFPKTLLTCKGSPIPSFSARKDPQLLQWRPFQMGRKGLSLGTQEEEITTLRCESHPAVERATAFQKLIQTFISIAQKNGKTDDYKQNDCHFWMHTVASLHPSQSPSSLPVSIFTPFSTALGALHTQCWMP